MRKLIAFAALAALAIAVASVPSHSQQDKSKRPSPPATAKCTFADGATITTDYSSPRKKGRLIYGDASAGALVPYGKVWRAGANEATTFVTTAKLRIDRNEIPAGEYTMFTVPNQNEWTLIINKKTGEWGIPYKWESDELFRVPMKVSSLPSPLEDFTISYANEGKACQLRLDWDTTRASANFTERK